MDPATQTTTSPRVNTAQETSPLPDTAPPAVDRRHATESRFLHLPREIRDMIYIFAMTSLPTRLLLSVALPFGLSFFYAKTLPAICFASNKLFEEATLAYTTRTHFVFADDPEQLGNYTIQLLFANFLSQFPNGAASVRMLGYPAVRKCDNRSRCYVYVPPETHFRHPEGLVSICPGLVSLMLVFPYETAISHIHTGKKLPTLS
jgi:hypothetical protein